MSINQYIKPITAERKDGELYIGGISAVELAKKYGTPLYVIDEATLRGIAREYKEAFKDYKNVRMMYASKALCTSAVTKILDEEGFGFDTISAGEIYTVYKAGVKMEKVLFNGNNKTPREIELALRLGVGRYSVDNFYEAELLNKIAEEKGVKADILIRITPGIECHTHDYIQTGQIDSKFGFDLTQTDEIITLIKNEYKNLVIRGIHAHIGSQIFELQSYTDEVEILIKEIMRINEVHSLSLDEINIGGGLGVKYTDGDNPPDVHALADAVAKTMKKYTSNLPTIDLEPGRSIISTSGITLYTAGSSKVVPNGRKYVAVDGGMADNPRPSMYQAKYFAEIADNTDGRETEKITLAGRYCESGDILIEEIELPQIKADDTICVYNTGAYNYSMASNYNRVEKPSMVLVNNSQSDIIVSRESLEDLISKDSIPSRLNK
ncbi:diaminopimelate decarboxylase [bacterium]|nr:diaminopimelate decarboxylase [bacterium]